MSDDAPGVKPRTGRRRRNDGGSRTVSQLARVAVAFAALLEFAAVAIALSYAGPGADTTAVVFLVALSAVAMVLAGCAAGWFLRRARRDRPWWIIAGSLVIVGGVTLAAAMRSL